MTTKTIQLTVNVPEPGDKVPYFEVYGGGEDSICAWYDDAGRLRGEPPEFAGILIKGGMPEYVSVSGVGS